MAFSGMRNVNSLFFFTSVKHYKQRDFKRIFFFPSKSNMARQEAGYEFSGGDGSEGGAGTEGRAWLVGGIFQK